MSVAEQKIYRQMRSLFTDVKEQKSAFYEPAVEIQRMKAQWRASSEANKKGVRTTKPLAARRN